MLIGLIASIFLNLCMLWFVAYQYKIIDRQTQYINFLEKQLKGLFL